MSLGIAIKAPEGIVLAAESRVTLGTEMDGKLIPVFFDNATKLFGLEPPNQYVGVVTYGQGAIGQRTAHSFLPEFEATLKTQGGVRLRVEEMAERLSDFYLAQWQSAMPKDFSGPAMTFLVGGLDDNQPYGRVFQVDVPYRPKPVEHSAGDQMFGITWGGQREIVDRLIQGYDARLLEVLKKVAELTDEDITALASEFAKLNLALPLNAMALQDCVDLAIFFVRTTIAAQALTVGLRGCGGQIDVATITRREGFSYVQRKKIVGEGGGS